MTALLTNQMKDAKIMVTTSLLSSKGADFVNIRIEDNGPSFPDHFPIFEPFNSTNPQSTGLGLTTVKELIEAHDGTISTPKSDLGGACIECILPIVN